MTSRAVANGPLAFHRGTEQKLLKYVTEKAEKGNLSDVIAKIDEFCWNTHWMMNLGDKKAHFYTSVIQKNGVKRVLELGTYCGYSTLVALAAMGDDGSIVCFDPGTNGSNEVAEGLFAHAGVSDRVTLHKESFGDPRSWTHGVFDLVLLDHAKNRYYPDLLILEKHHALRPGGTLLADNVVVFRIDDVVNHVTRASLRYKNVRIEKGFLLEYTDPKRDSEVHEDGVLIATAIAEVETPLSA